ncbi:MAG TPA: Fur family transcriptional regulator [Candidatus Paceibacterota bacterium]|nr:Fur family transcriptional regulator [Candidatus Paceibacterota bacterium]
MKTNFEELLREHGFRSTKSRVKLLETLQKLGKPVSIQTLRATWEKDCPDQVTLYRALEALAESGIIQRVDLGHSHAHYEFQKEHHHHVICTSCGAIEDVEHCDITPLEKAVAKRSSKFSRIDSHSLEFFGHCDNCIKKSA